MTTAIALLPDQIIFVRSPPKSQDSVWSKSWLLYFQWDDILIYDNSNETFFLTQNFYIFWVDNFPRYSIFHFASRKVKQNFVTSFSLQFKFSILFVQAVLQEMFDINIFLTINIVCPAGCPQGASADIDITHQSPHYSQIYFDKSEERRGDTWDTAVR